MGLGLASRWVYAGAYWLSYFLATTEDREALAPLPFFSPRATPRFERADVRLLPRRRVGHRRSAGVERPPRRSAPGLASSWAAWLLLVIAGSWGWLGDDCRAAPPSLAGDRLGGAAAVYRPFLVRRRHVPMARQRSKQGAPHAHRHRLLGLGWPRGAAGTRAARRHRDGRALVPCAPHPLLTASRVPHTSSNPDPNPIPSPSPHANPNRIPNPDPHPNPNPHPNADPNSKPKPNPNPNPTPMMATLVAKVT